VISATTRAVSRCVRRGGVDARARPRKKATSLASAISSARERGRSAASGSSTERSRNPSTHRQMPSSQRCPGARARGRVLPPRRHGPTPLVRGAHRPARGSRGQSPAQTPGLPVRRRRGSPEHGAQQRPSRRSRARARSGGSPGQGRSSRPPPRARACTPLPASLVPAAGCTVSARRVNRQLA
jgi:hypothetical protein